MPVEEGGGEHLPGARPGRLHRRGAEQVVEVAMYRGGDRCRRPAPWERRQITVKTRDGLADPVGERSVDLP